LPVRRHLRIAVFSTGNEIAAPGNPLGPTQIYDASATPADINRNGRPTSVGMGGRLQAGINGRLRRNAQLRHHM
jgi:hypothetical protein